MRWLATALTGKRNRRSMHIMQKAIVLTQIAVVIAVMAISAFALPQATPAVAPAAPGAASASAPATAARQVAQLPAGDTDKTLAALHDELARSRERLVLPGQEKPYYIEYRLLD